MVWRKGICRESLLNCRRTLRKGLNLQNDPVDRLAKRGNPARKGSPLAPTFYRLAVRRAGENSLLATRVVVACCAGARKGEPPRLFCPCRSKVALLRWFAHIAPVAPQGIIAASATGRPLPFFAPQRRGAMVRVGKYFFSLLLLSSANGSPALSALQCPKKSSRGSLAQFFRPLRMLRLAASATGSARLRIPLTAIGK